MNQIDLDPRFQLQLERTLRDEPGAPGALLRIETPEFTWSGAAGHCDPTIALPMRPDDAFQIASITKMLTATLCIRLAEEELLNLDSGIGAYLPESVTRGLHVIDGHDFGPELTLRQLLSHTSGVADFFSNGTPVADGNYPFVAEMKADPDRLWQPAEVVDWTKGHLAPCFAPGDGWHYAGTGFLLAGLVIEAVTGLALQEAYRRWIFTPLGMRHSYLLHREATRPVENGRPASRPYSGATDYGSLRSTSADWGSGGLVSTTADLARFLRAFVEGDAFRDPWNRAQMMTWVRSGERGVSYGLGIRHFDLDKLGFAGGGELWGHTGFLKAFMLYWPAGDAILCGTLNQSAASGVFSDLRPVATLVRDILPLLRRL